MEPLFLLSLVSAALPSTRSRKGDLFRSVAPVHRNRWPCFLASAFLHVILLLLYPIAAEQFVGEEDRDFWVRRQRVIRTLRVRVPEQLYIASNGSQPVRKIRLRPLKQSGGDGAQRAADTGRLGRRSLRRRLELPRLARQVESARTLLQPQFAHDEMIATPMELPEVFFWAPKREAPEYAKPYVTPGHAAAPTLPWLLDAVPRLALPTSERAAMNIPPLPDSINALRALATAAVPVRVTEADGSSPRTGVSADRLPGDPTTLLSLAADPLQLREFLSVPSGNQLGRLPETALPAPASGPLTAEGSGGRGRSGDGTGDGTGANGAHPGEPGFEGGAAGSATNGLRSAALAAAESTRLLHPAAGVFDVVVQSSGVEGFPESAGVLSGKPVYSVFIAAGGAKDWILQYCIPAGEDHSVEVSGPVVRLGTGSALSAPYPRVTLRPAIRPRPGQYVMVHGVITAAGRFDELKLLGTPDLYEREIVPEVLGQWQFRPAMRDGQPVRVEVLVAIPAG